MTPKDTETPRPPSPEEESAAAAVRALGTPRMAEDFRARLRAQFVAGTFEERVPKVLPGRRSHGPQVVALFGLAAAACIALVVWLGGQAPPWRWEGARGDAGRILISERAVDPADPAAAEAMLRPGASVRTTGSMEVDLSLKNRLSVQLAPGTKMTVPRWPHRWFGGAATCEVTEGEARFVTGAGFGDSRLLIRSTLASIEVTGTTLAVIAGADSTCVCVLEGEVTMIDDDGATTSVPAGMRRALSRSGPPLVTEILPMERMKLEMVRDATAAR